MHKNRQIDFHLPQKRADLENMAINIASAVYWKDLNGVYLGCNSAMLKLLGLKNANEIIGKTDAQVGWNKKNTTDELTIEQTQNIPITIQLEENFVLRDGEKIPVILYEFPLLDEKNNAIGVIGIIIDISAQQINGAVQVKKRLQAIIDTIAGNHWWKDKTGHYLGCSMASAKLCGLNSPQEVIGKTDYELPWSSTADALVAHDQEVMEGGKTVKREEVITTTEGKALILLVTKTPLKDDDGSIIGTIGTSVDITEMKQLEQSLEEARDQAELSDKLKTQFIMNMEHDFRTPFSGIWGLADILKNEETDERKKEYLDDIKKCAEELLNYFADILNYAKVEMGLWAVQDKKFNLRNVIDSVIKVEKPAVKNKNLEIIVHIDHSLPPVLRGDNRRLYQILINLISNAIKFTNEGYVKLLVSLIKETNDREMIVRFTIKDTGLGIPPDKVSYLYEKFNRLTPSNKGLHKGMGLGLKIVKQFVNEMGGEIDVETAQDKGTEFHCTFPFKIPLTSEFADV